MKINSPNEQVITFHDHRFTDDGAGNTDYLPYIRSLLDKKEDKKISSGDGIYFSCIVSLGISTGFDLGNEKCFDVFKEAIKEEKTSPLILFENYLTISQESDKNLWEFLHNKTSKLIVLNKDRDTREKSNSHSAAKLKEQTENKVLLFRPYTEGKFHHKLLINYPKEENDPPIIYTGSFHLSNNAIKNNSENIIGIASKELAENYIASILWQSALANQQEVWNFIGQHPKTFFESKPIQEVAEKISLQTNFSIKKIPYQFNYIVKKLLLTDKKTFKKIDGFEKRFSEKFGLKSVARKIEFGFEAEEESILPEIKPSFDNDQGIVFFKNEIKIIFNNIKNGYILRKLESIDNTAFLTENIPDISDPLSEEKINTYLDNLEEWLEESWHLLELRKYKNLKNIDDIKKKLTEVNHIYDLLRQASEFPGQLQDFLKFRKTVSTNGIIRSEIVSPDDVPVSTSQDFISADGEAILTDAHTTVTPSLPTFEEVQQNGLSNVQFCEFVRFLADKEKIRDKIIKFLENEKVSKGSITMILKGKNISATNAYTAGKALVKKYEERYNKWIKTEMLRNVD